MQLELLDHVSLDTAGPRTAETRINGLTVLYPEILFVLYTGNSANYLNHFIGAGWFHGCWFWLGS